ncbi:hypothetical protein DIPPA_05150 [Diplonema papillatum]|nr:hypothetical protein DIPPA_05150 [Diplonema papillatum]
MASWLLELKAAAEFVNTGVLLDVGAAAWAALLLALLSAAYHVTQKPPVASRSPKMHAALIRHLAQDVWARIGPSPLHGVGVFAIRDVPKGQVIDRIPGDTLPMKRRTQVPSDVVEMKELLEAGVEKEVIDYVTEMYVCSEGSMDICRYGMNVFMGLSHFVNHSEAPNVAFADSDGAGDVGFNMKVVSIATIKKGEELLADYRDYLTPEELARLPGMGHIKHSEKAPA